MTAATGFASDELALPELAGAAVKEALQKADSEHPQSVILMLTSHFARHAQAAVAAASRAANCLQIAGCTVPGVFTDSDVALDRPAAAALALFGDINLGAPTDDSARLFFATPSQLDQHLLAGRVERFGTMATDGDEDGVVWVHGRPSLNGHAESALHGARMQIGVSRGLRMLTPLMRITDSDSFEVLRLDEQTALDSLLKQLDSTTRKLDELPPQRLFAALPEPNVDEEVAMACGRYTLLPILRVNRDERSVTLAAPLPIDSRLCWVMRDAALAEQEMCEVAATLVKQPRPAAFGLMFSCIGRGPYFHGGSDRDVAAVIRQFPSMPLIGAYCGGEIAPLGGNNRLISYSSVLALAEPDV